MYVYIYIYAYTYMCKRRCYYLLLCVDFAPFMLYLVAMIVVRVFVQPLCLFIVRAGEPVPPSAFRSHPLQAGGEHRQTEGGL